MKKILLNISNQIGAGPKNISLNFLRALAQRPELNEVVVIASDDPDVQAALSQLRFSYVTIPRWRSGPFKLVRFVYLQAVIIFLSTFGNYDKFLAFGNFMPFGFAKRKAVLLHHPYLVEDKLLADLPVVSRQLERLKRLLFRVTLWRVDVVIVQSTYMKERFAEKYPNFKGKVGLVSNPISDLLFESGKEYENHSQQLCLNSEQFALFYPSRFYPHKNHEFLIQVGREIVTRGLPITITVTLDQKIEGVDLFLDAAKQEGLPIRNIGELPQQELRDVYRSSHAVIFPSKAETFGNPLVEAMMFSLPVVAPRKGYSLAILAETGHYYEEGDVTSCVDQCATLLQNCVVYKEARMKSHERAASFPDSRTWCEYMLAAMND